jgi:uncharacterized membrane protein (UPF0182 family)
LLAWFGSGFYTDWLWFANLGLSSVFAAGIAWRWIIGLATGALFALFLWVNLNIALAGRVGTLPGIIELPIGPMIAPRQIRRYLLVGAAALGGFIGLNMSAYWLTFLRYLNQVSFGVAEPIFGLDVAHYVFTVPVMALLYQYLMSALVLAAIGVLLIYVLTGDLSFDVRRVRLSGRARAHVSLLVGAMFAVKAIGYRVNLYRLLYSPRGQVFGASFTDVNAEAIALRMLFWLSLAVAALLVVNLRLRRTNLIVAGVALMVGVSFILGTLYPTFVQQFTVEPDELNKERVYIGHNIELTRRAWDLEDIDEVDYPIQGELTMADISRNRDTIDNIRLWDYRPLRATYGQLQEIRAYYAFNDADIDRYRFGNEYRQVSLAVRELDTDRLPERTWINQHLVYTHGYGLVMSPVNRATPEGLPELWIRDVPPVLAGPPAQTGFSVDQVRSYYGELTRTYAIVNTKQPEFDYPLGEVNASIHYDGQGGVRLSSPLVRLAFALRMRSYQIFLADAITTESRIMFYRNIRDRVQRIAPFLTYDRDAYPVVLDGRLYWIIDAYTMTAGYPYSEPLPAIRANYVRNSVKVVIDAYEGSTRYYLFDPDDPLAATYSRIFPQLFTPMSEMPEGLRAHLRYPIDLFSWQSQMFLTYHMRDPVTFYNKEDVWTIPTETYQTRNQPVEPYYLIMRLPGGEGPEFVLMTPFVPRGRNNMIAWLAARSDGDAYGHRIVYRFPKQELVFGPAQIESRIDQDTEISRDLTLWGQRGSEVIRGHLLVIPINGQLLYVEPIYLQAETTRLPEMKRVVVAYRDRVVMAETFDAALRGVFAEGPAPPGGGEQTLAELVARATRLYDQAEQAVRRGDWAEYGRLQLELRQVLRDLEARAAGLTQ